MFPRSAVLAVLAAGSATLALVTSGCSINIDTHGLTVNGTRLDEEHEESLTIDTWHASGLIVDTGMGDVTIEPTSGPNRITATLHEVEEGDARLTYEDGHLGWVTKSGEPAAIGDVEILVADELPALRISSGQGDVDCDRIIVTQDLVLDLGMGDLSLEDTTVGGLASLDTGMGDLSLERVEADTLRGTTGLGDADLEHVTALTAQLSSGMGDICVEHGAFSTLNATTGLGDLVCRDTRYEVGNLDTGLGDLVED